MGTRGGRNSRGGNVGERDWEGDHEVLKLAEAREERQ